MANINEASWYSMMGLSKIFLRNFLIGCFLLCIISIATLANIINNVTQERIKDEKEYRMIILEIQRKCADQVEIKHAEYIQLLKEALLNQKEIDRDIETLQNNYPKAKR